MHRLLVALLLLLTACSGTPEAEPGAATEETPFAIVANSPGTLSVGEERLLIALLAPDTTSLAEPDRPAELNVVFDGEIVQTLDADFLWAVPDIRGLYRVNIEFDQPGNWAVIVTTPDLEVSLPAQFQVTDTDSVPGVGSVAPPSQTGTATEDFSAVSSDPDPDPRFYQVSLDEAVASGIQLSWCSRPLRSAPRLRAGRP